MKSISHYIEEPNENTTHTLALNDPSSPGFANEFLLDGSFIIILKSFSPKQDFSGFSSHESLWGAETAKYGILPVRGTTSAWHSVCVTVPSSNPFDLSAVDSQQVFLEFIPSSENTEAHSQKWLRSSKFQGITCPWEEESGIGKSEVREYCADTSRWSLVIVLKDINADVWSNEDKKGSCCSDKECCDMSLQINGNRFLYSSSDPLRYRTPSTALSFTANCQNVQQQRQTKPFNFSNECHAAEDHRRSKSELGNNKACVVGTFEEFNKILLPPAHSRGDSRGAATSLFFTAQSRSMILNCNPNLRMEGKL